MSRRNQILVGLLLLVVLSAAVRYGLGALFPQYFAVGSPNVSVKAEPVFNYDFNTGFHFGAAMFEGGHHPSGIVVTNAQLMALVTLVVLAILAFIVNAISRVNPGKFQAFVEIVVDGIYNTMGSVDRRYIARFWPLVGTVFFYVLFSNWLGLIPGVFSIGYHVDEALLQSGAATAAQTTTTTNASGSATPTTTAEGAGNTQPAGAEAAHQVLVPLLRSPSADLNNTLMLGLVAFFFIEYWGFKELGPGYLRKFWPLKEFGAVGAFVGPLELISEFVRIISFAFRLFGNIFAGEVILLVMLFLFPLLPIPFLALELFVGFIQAFVFAILVMAFASLATQGHGDHDEHHVAGIDDEPFQAELGGTTRQNPVAS